MSRHLGFTNTCNILWVHICLAYSNSLLFSIETVTFNVGFIGKTEKGNFATKINLFKFNNRNIRTRCEICSKLTPE